METTPTRKQQTHDRIRDTAARVLRDGGFDGVGVADIMKKAGLTHGGFYAHFPSREALLAEALARAGEDSELRLDQAIAAGTARGASAFESLVDNYLSPRHLHEPSAGCPVAALASEMPRQPEAVRAAAAASVQALVARVQSCLPDQDAGTAGVIASQLAGALQLARTLGDNARGRKHLAASRRFLLEQFETGRPGRR